MRRYLSDVLTVLTASVAAMLTGMALGVENYISAGIVAILTIQPSNRETLKTAAIRLVAFICALLISAVTFNIAGFNIAGFTAYLVIYVALCIRFKWISAMAVNSVLISHFIGFGNMSVGPLINEALIFVLGVGMGIVVNILITRRKSSIRDLEMQADEQIRTILKRMADRIVNRDIEDYDGKCLVTLDRLIDKAIRAARQEHADKILDDSTYELEYIRMRGKQYEVLLEMYKKVSRLDTTPETAEHVALFMERVSAEYSRDNDVKDLIAALDRLEGYMKTQPLPDSRKEFEDRALLFALFIDLREFLEIKMEFAQKEPESFADGIFR